MADVYYTEIRIAGDGRPIAGIDNFSLRAVPEPSTLLLLPFGAAVLRRIRRPKEAPATISAAGNANDRRGKS